MAKIERGNVVLDVEDYEVPRYLMLGYNRIDEKNGAILEYAVPTNLGALQAEYLKCQTIIAELRDENIKLKTELENNKSVKKSKKSKK